MTDGALPDSDARSPAGEREQLRAEVARLNRTLEAGRRELAALVAEVGRRQDQLIELGKERKQLEAELAWLEAEANDTWAEIARPCAAAAGDRVEPTNPRAAQGPNEVGHEANMVEVERERRRLERAATTAELLDARDRLVALTSTSADLNELREVGHRFAGSLIRVTDDDELWNELRVRERRSVKLSEQQLLRLQMAGDIDGTVLLKGLGTDRALSLDVLTLHRDLAIGVADLLEGRAEARADVVRQQLRELARELEPASPVDAPGAERLHRLVRAVLFVAARVALIVGLVGAGVGTLSRAVPRTASIAVPDAAQALAAVTTGGALHGLERMLGWTSKGQNEKEGRHDSEPLERALRSLGSSAFADLNARWSARAASGVARGSQDQPIPTQELVGKTLLFLNRQLADVYLTYESTLLEPLGTRAFQGECDDLLGALRTARKLCRSADDRPTELVAALDDLERRAWRVVVSPRQFATGLESRAERPC